MVKYIYNWEQVKFYISKGVMPIDRPKINANTNKIYFVFSTEETEEVYSLWCKECNKYKR